MVNKKLQVWLPLLFSVVMIAGMFFGFKLNQQTGSKKGFFKMDRRNSLQEAMDLIKMRYVDSIGIDNTGYKVRRAGNEFFYIIHINSLIFIKSSTKL